MIVLGLAPEAEPRHRSRVVIPRRPGARPFVQTFAPPRSDWWNAVDQSAKENRPKKPLDGAVAVFAQFFCRKPSGYRKGEIFKRTRPDGDNMRKLIQDALQRNGWFADDGQVAFGAESKILLSDRDKPEGVIVRAWELGTSADAPLPAYHTSFWPARHAVRDPAEAARVWADLESRNWPPMPAPRSRGPA